MRGNPGERRQRLANPRSIPAYAGEPVSPPTPPYLKPVYPRVCGGTFRSSRVATARNGLSPRMRGNPGCPSCPSRRRRSIPAYAGEPGWITATPAMSGVYPRVCGGTALGGRRGHSQRGLSPRMRGNPAVVGVHADAAGSIPAYAGEPGVANILRRGHWVYPRVCGGTLCQPPACPRPPHCPGLSPRMRGNPEGVVQSGSMLRSIPAYAGEPAAHGHNHHIAKVYPRVCGGTGAGKAGAAHIGGLSPRMRGNRCSRVVVRYMGGSIPAYAGEPPRQTSDNDKARVYPRVCGGTVRANGDGTLTYGLSPRMRGNHNPAAARDDLVRSIPAYAGEPPGRP